MFDVPHSVRPQPSTFNSQPAERGIALVITLILLSVTLFMAVAFLAISRRERNSVITETDNVTARLASDSALANAEAQILATVLQTTNPYSFGLVVSTNYINGNGYNPAFLPNPANPVNVSYVYGNGNPLSPGDFVQNVANLLYLPRAPVFAYDRTTGATDFRYYLDLNRNASFDASGPVLETNSLGNPTGATIPEIGDPQWIGVLERPDLPHGPNNKFLSRYAFIAMPVGNTLDLNYIHNQTLTPNGAQDGYFRNEGVGSWELNLAAFLTDLNTNKWDTLASPYSYQQWKAPSFPNTGFAFEDARALLYWRYANNYNTLAIPSATMISGLVNAGIDGYTIGNLMTSPGLPSVLFPANQHWAGSDNTNHFFEISSELFDPGKSSIQFTNNLFSAGTGVSTYDHYTFYRMLAQLGTDSSPDSGKLNVNYVNVDAQGNIIPDYQTNFFAWTPDQFFTNAADRMLRAYTTKWFQDGPSNYLATYYGIHTNYNNPTAQGLVNLPYFGMTNQIPAFGIANIPVLVNGTFAYTPAVQRVLQLAANIYDATTNNNAAMGKDFPSVFRPLFSRNTAGDLFVTGYANVPFVTGPADVALSPPFEASQIAQPTGNNVLVNVYGVPWIIGAKKGFPSFNEISTEDVVNITRKMQITKGSTAPSAATTATNVAYSFNVNNALGVEFWNSYTNGFTNPVQVVVYDKLTMELTNDAGYAGVMNYSLSAPSATPTFTIWPGSTWYPGGTLNTSASSPFYVPINVNNSFITNCVYKWLSHDFQPAATAGWETTVTALNLPQFGLLVTNRLQAFILGTDKSGGQHVIDYVHFNGPDHYRDLNAEIQTSLGRDSYDNMWDTNVTTGRVLPYGINSQISVSQGTGYSPGYWTSDPFAAAEIDAFYVFLGGSPSALPRTLGTLQMSNVFNSYLTNLTMQVPYTPSVTAYYYTSWQANDPLVHSLASDLTFSDPAGPPRTGTNVVYSPPAATIGTLLPNIGAVNKRYLPWGKTRQAIAGIDQSAYNMAYQDSLVRQSDDWAFPGTKLPSVGWLGRIHRGTPWQTVFLKATNILGLASGGANGTNTWKLWTGDINTYDAANNAPVQDRLLFDVFSGAFNDNATRGQLPINVAASDTGDPAAAIAAWSALFSGVVVLTNIGPNALPSPTYAAITIDPAGGNGLNSPLGRLVQGIFNTRTNKLLNPQQAFEHVGDILAVPQFSEQSPFLNWNSSKQSQSGISDALYEWLPQQTMPLLRVSDQPRFVIYSYGQTLKPAPNGVLTSGTFPGMITNYQVVAEQVTRSVVRVEGAPTNTHAVVESFNILPPD